MKRTTHGYTTIQVKKDVNKLIREFCVKYNVNASTITEMMWENYISSSQHIKEIMVMADTAKLYLISASMSGSIAL